MCVKRLLLLGTCGAAGVVAVRRAAVATEQGNAHAMETNCSSTHRGRARGNANKKENAAQIAAQVCAHAWMHACSHHQIDSRLDQLV